MDTFLNVLIIFTNMTIINAIIQFGELSKGKRANICGQVEDKGDIKSLLHCSEKCLINGHCKGILFPNNKSTKDNATCKLVTSGHNTMLNINETEGFEIYSIKTKPKPGVCNNLGIGVPTPSGWGSGCPRVYFPLDSAVEGTAVGGGSAAIQFVIGKVGNSFYFPNPDANIQAYFDLGIYPLTSYCFPDPERCVQGVSFAFWLNLLTPGSAGIAGQITTMPNEGPGFLLFTTAAGTPVFTIRRDSDSMEELIGLDEADFQINYGHDVWVHYMITYKFDGTNAGNNMELYINGKVEAAAWKTIDPWPQANNADFSGTLNLGAFYTGYQGWATGNLKLDELIIFEEQLPCEDAIKLYQAYQP